LSGVENITLQGGSSESQEIQASLLSGATYAIKADVTSASGTLVVNVASTDTVVNLSTLVLSDAVDTTVANMTATTSAATNTASIAITGGTKIKNNITGSSASDTLTGGTLNDTFNYSTDALLFSSDNVGYDSIVGGAGNADVLKFTATATPVEVVALDSWAKVSGVEQITTSDNTGNISITLGATAESAGINTVNLAGDSTASTGSNVVNAAAYTTKITITSGAEKTAITGGAGGDALTGGAGIDTITGGAGNDTITGAGAADVISAGEGDDTLTYLATLDLFASNAAVDSITGGDGTDTLSVGTSGTDFTIAATDIWTRVTGVETIKAVANTVDALITLDDTAWTAGVRTVNISAVDSTGAEDDSLIDASDVSGGGLTLIGSAKGITSITGGDGADTITGGIDADVIIGGDGADTVVFASTAALNGSDVLTLDTTDVLNFTAFLGAGYTRIGEIGDTITAIADSGNADVNITGKLAILEVANADAGEVDTPAELFDLIDGATNAFALSSGRAVIIVNDLGTAAAGVGNDDGDSYIFFIDTTLDGASGLSVSDIILVGTAVDIAGTDDTWTWESDNFA
jgi:Ca2+-binding RTX toxin-like protein